MNNYGRSLLRKYGIFILCGVVPIASFGVTLWVLASLETQPGINVSSASYGENCGAPWGNVTRKFQNECDGKFRCSFAVNSQSLGDPVPGCDKSFAVSYACLPNAQNKLVDFPKTGSGINIELTCPR